MANMCMNDVRITGKVKDVKKFFKLVGRDFDFNKIIPLKGDSCAESDKKWGCTSISFDTECDDSDLKDGQISWVFFTKWNAPSEIFKALREKFPKVNIVWRYEEPGCDLYGYLQNEV